MSYQFVVLPAAKTDIQSAVDWYEKQQIGLSKKFKHQIIETIDRISDPVRGIWDSLYGLYAILHHKQESVSILEKRSKL